LPGYAGNAGTKWVPYRLIISKLLRTPPSPLLQKDVTKTIPLDKETGMGRGKIIYLKINVRSKNITKNFFRWFLLKTNLDLKTHSHHAILGYPRQIIFYFFYQDKI
jgi:hypothetical protein